jgi:expansin
MRLAHRLLVRSFLAAALLSLTACGSEPAPDIGEAPGTDAGTGMPPGNGTDAGTGSGTDAGTGTGTGTNTMTSRPLEDYKDGIITYYSEADGTGNCGFDATPDDLDVAAIVKTEYQGSAVCGACAEIQGPKGTLRVRIVDSCPDCTVAHHLDLSPSAFAKLADPAAGRVQVKWRFVTCPVSGPVRYRFKEGSSQWWTAIQVRNHHKPIRKLEALQGLSWVELPRQDYNYFLDSSGLGLGTLALRATAWDGEVIQDVLPGILDSQVVSGLHQFTPLP